MTLLRPSGPPVPPGARRVRAGPRRELRPAQPLVALVVPALVDVFAASLPVGTCPRHVVAALEEQGSRALRPVTGQATPTRRAAGGARGTRRGSVLPGK